MNQIDKFYRYLKSLFKGYHIIIVPKERARTKTFQVSGFSLKVLIASVILAVPLFLGSVLSAIHYQNKVIALKKDSSANQDLLESKKELILKLSLFEKTLTQMDESIAHLSQVMDIDPTSLQVGLGPISEIDTYLEDENVSALSGSLTQDAEGMIEDWVDNHGDISTTKFNRQFSELKQQSNFLNKKITSLFEQNKDKIRFVNAAPALLPVNGWVTSEFGVRKHPLSHHFKMHYGIDVAAPHGTLIKSPADGIVVYSGYSGGYGQVVVVDHGYGISSLMAHTSKIDAKLGDQIKRGDVLAYVGSSGAVSGAHLHYEIRVDGIPTDPMQFIAQQ